MREGWFFKRDTYDSLPLKRVGPDAEVHFTQAREKLSTHVVKAATFEGLIQVIEQFGISVVQGERRFVLNDRERLVAVSDLTDALRAVEVSFHASTKEFQSLPTILASIDSVAMHAARLAERRLQQSVEYRSGTKLPIGKGGESISLHRVSGIVHEGSAISSHEALVVPGFRSGPRSFEEFALDVSARGHHTTVLDVASTPKEVDSALSIPPGTPPLLAAHTTAVGVGLRHVYERSAQKVDLVGHSFGAMSAVLAARANPDSVRSITLVNPAGMPGGMEKYPKLARLVNMGWIRKPKEVAQQKRLGKDPAVKERQRVDNEERESRLRSEEKGTALQVGDIVSGFSIAPFVEELIAQGITVTIILTSEDHMFPASDIKHEAQRHGIEDTLVERPGPHNAIKYEPGSVAASVVSAGLRGQD